MSIQPQTADVPKPGGRIAAIDVARGVALLAMASYHFTWDLENFGYAEAGLTAYGWWKIYARCIASTFLFLVGVGLVLAHGNGIRWNGFWKRFAMVAASALAITAVTWFMFPGGFIFFGILHQIALASLLGLAFVRLPALLTLVAVALVIAAPYYLRADVFNYPALWWVGLSTINPRSSDYVPLFPWFGAVLAGIGIAKLAISSGVAARLASLSMPRLDRSLGFLGRHSLAFYLIHQPVLFALVGLLSLISPAEQETRQVQFLQTCQRSCEDKRDTEFCARYCVCMLDALDADGTLDKLYDAEESAELKAHVGDLANQCTAETDSGAFGGGTQ